MPEAPEIRISCEKIKPLIQNKIINNIILTSTGRYGKELPSKYNEFCSTLGKIHDPIYLTDIAYKGKFVYWTFSNGWNGWMTYGMSGQFSPEKGKHPAYYFEYQNKEQIKQIYFNDPRHFGTLKFSNSQQELKEKLSSLGWSPFDLLTDQDQKMIFNRLKSSKKTIGEVLMDQSVFCGVGNYLKCEICYETKISPKRLASSLSQQEILDICYSASRIAERSYQMQGATIHTYKDPSGNKGNFANFFKCYGRKTDGNGNQIVKYKAEDGRSTYWCPIIQR